MQNYPVDYEEFARARMADYGRDAQRYALEDAATEGRPGLFRQFVTWYRRSQLDPGRPYADQPFRPLPRH
jgi:hypothetical protein